MIKHGGDWAGFESKYGHMPLDFSANVSPLGMPESALTAAHNALQYAAQYPDPLCRALRKAAAEHWKTDEDVFLFGNGALELVYRFVQATRPRRAVIAEPTFLEYRKVLEQYGCEIVSCPLREENDFSLTEEILPMIQDSIDLVILCEPNNPTGRVTKAELLEKILRKCREKKTALLVDTCFSDFLEENLRFPWENYLSDRPIILLKAMTKFYGMAGLRLGYCMSRDQKLLERMQEEGNCWNVSNIAQSAGIAAFRDEAYAQRLRELIAGERAYLQKKMSELPIRCISGCANYLLFRAEREDLCENLEKRGILIRSCCDYPGLSKKWYRIAVRTREENTRLIEAMKEVLTI